MKLNRPAFIAIGVVTVAVQVSGIEGISHRSRTELALRDYAKLMCSAVFVSGRNLIEAERDSGPLVTENIGSSYSVLSEADRTQVQVLVDQKGKLVTAELPKLPDGRGGVLRRPGVCDSASRR